jgi:hypothetical protein
VRLALRSLDARFTWMYKVRISALTERTGNWTQAPPRGTQSEALWTMEIAKQFKMYCQRRYLNVQVRDIGNALRVKIDVQPINVFQLCYCVCTLQTLKFMSQYVIRSIGFTCLVVVQGVEAISVMNSLVDTPRSPGQLCLDGNLYGFSSKISEFAPSAEPFCDDHIPASKWHVRFGPSDLAIQSG